MDDEQLAAMEARLMARINDAQEAIIGRVRSCETAIFALIETTRANNTTMVTLTALMTDMARRVTDLERKS